MYNPIFKKAFVALNVVMALNAFAQEPIKSSCSQKLKEMQKNYEQGVLSPIPEALADCMSGGFTKTEKLQSYRLIILTYLFLDETQKAQKAMNDLLVYEPDYQPNKALDPVEYIKLFESFNVLPFFSYGISLGANLSNPKMVNSYSTNSDGSSEAKFSNANGFNVGVALEYLIAKNLFLGAEGYIYLRNFKKTESVLPRSVLTSDESQTSIQIPLTLKYAFGKGRLKPYLRAGAAIDLLIGDQSQMIRKNTISSQNDNAGAAQNLLKNRNSINVFGLVGAGLNYKLGYGFLFIDVRYLYGISNFSKVSERYSDFKEKIPQYAYIDPDFGINNYQISVGYMLSLYKVKKKKTGSEID